MRGIRSITMLSSCIALIERTVPSWLDAVDQLETDGANEDRLAECLGEMAAGNWNALPVGVSVVGHEAGKMESVEDKYQNMGKKLIHTVEVGIQNIIPLVVPVVLYPRFVVQKDIVLRTRHGASAI